MLSVTIFGLVAVVAVFTGVLTRGTATGVTLGVVGGVTLVPVGVGVGVVHTRSPALMFVADPFTCTPET